ncbi:MAG: hypothetical protein LBB11_00290 [Puniceicoccales bacterium]|jgi:hypothetical protein|nr:hypothetical protein [Puniceicoccales bacterium]
MVWNLVYDGDEKTLAEWGINNMVRRLKNQTVDQVTFKISGNGIDTPLPFEPKKVIKIFHDEVLWFTGIVTKTPICGSAVEEFFQYTLSGPWWYLDSVIYQQLWKEFLDPDNNGGTLMNARKSHLILGQDANGDAINIGTQIVDVINYVNAAVGYTVIELAEDMSLPMYIPFDECKDLSCSEVIKRLLRWIPDAISYFDYGQNVPVLHIVRREQLETLSMNAHDLSELSFAPRYDLQVPAVMLKFEKTHKTNEGSWKTIEVQRFPEDAIGMELQALVMTIELEGMQSTFIRQDVKVAMIQIGSETWWRDHLPGLQNVSNLVIEDVTREGNLPNELLSGSIADWMNCNVEPERIKAKISYETEDEIVYEREVVVKMNSTDAQSKTYKNLISYISEESVPENLAESIYQGVSVLPYEGQVKWIHQELEGTFLGKVLNIVDGREEWASMNALIQSVEENLDRGEINIIVGPAKHLGPDDLSELTKSNRHRFSSRNFYARSTAEAGGNAYVEQGKYSPLENTAYGPGKLGKLSFGDPNSENRKILIDIGDLAVEEATVCLRLEDVSDSGVLKKRYSLASEPFLPLSTD